MAIRPEPCAKTLPLVYQWQVKKPQDVTTKFKAFLTQHADKFTLNGENVSLTPKK
jgi:hypothetical protein